MLVVLVGLPSTGETDNRDEGGWNVKCVEPKESTMISHESSTFFSYSSSIVLLAPGQCFFLCIAVDWGFLVAVDYRQSHRCTN